MDELDHEVNERLIEREVVTVQRVRNDLIDIQTKCKTLGDIPNELKATELLGKSVGAFKEVTIDIDALEVFNQQMDKEQTLIAEQLANRMLEEPTINQLPIIDSISGADSTFIKATPVELSPICPSQSTLKEYNELTGHPESFDNNGNTVNGDNNASSMGNSDDDGWDANSIVGALDSSTMRPVGDNKGVGSQDKGSREGNRTVKAPSEQQDMTCLCPESRDNTENHSSIVHGTEDRAEITIHLPDDPMARNDGYVAIQDSKIIGQSYHNSTEKHGVVA
jgi:hypothetical protein